MFEAFTFEVILEDMLSRVASDVDKREGSMIYDALAPAAYHLAEMYFYLDTFVDLVSGDTAIGTYLDRIAADQGLSRKEATNAIRKIETSGPVNIGTRWAINDVTYTITALISTNTYSAACEQAGAMGNTYSGALENIDNVSGVNATLTDIIYPGEDEEADNALRARFFARVRIPATSGNAYQYRQWALEVSGIGDAKIFPLWSGPGSVKVVILDSSKQPATAALTDAVAEYIEMLRPIGAAVTVSSGTDKVINTSARLTLAPGYSLQAAADAFADAAREYFKSIAFSLPYVSFAKVGTILLGVDGVLDYSDLQLNGSSSNVILTNEEVPVLGSVNMGV